LTEPAHEKAMGLDHQNLLTAEETAMNNDFVFSIAALTNHFAPVLQMGTTLCALTLCSRRWRPL
jgi:hypothetical protein